LHVVQVG
jgi:toxin ParE1/3/4